MQNLTLIIPTKKEAESLPTFLKEIENYNCKKLIVLEKEDIESRPIWKPMHLQPLYKEFEYFI